MTLVAALREDFKANRGNSKGLFIAASYRLANWCSKRKQSAIAFLPAHIYLAIYKIVVNWLLCVEIHPDSRIGLRLQVFHGHGLVVSRDAQIGDDVVLRQGTTIGNRRRGGPSPRIGNCVEIGANAVVLGDICIGDEAKIGACALVIRDVPSGASVLAPEAKISARD